MIESTYVLVGATGGRPRDAARPSPIVPATTRGDRRSPLHLIQHFVERTITALLLALTFASCTPDSTGDRPVTLRLTNTGAEPLQCRLMFGHWVDRDLGRLAPGEGVDIAIMQQDTDGALYILRDDGARRMMIETINCGREGNWMESFGQVDLASARAARPANIAATCAAPPGPGRVTCPAADLAPSPTAP